jgi:hypothetical protein
MKTIFILFLCCFLAANLYGQITSEQSGNWSSTTTWTGGVVPTSANDVMISVDHVVNIDVNNAECNSISFGDETSKLAMLSNAVLNIYGNFTIKDTSNHFWSWEPGAKIKFTGSAVQTLSGWSKVTTKSPVTTLMEVVVDKSGGSVTTAGYDMKLNLGSSLEIINGTFTLASSDDIQGRLLDGSGAAEPTIIIRSGGTFTMAGGASHIGAGDVGTPRPPIGNVTVYGLMTVVTTSTNLINFSGMDVEAGAQLNFPTGWSTARFNPGTLTVKNGGIILHSTTTNFWATGAALVLQNGSVYKTTASNPTAFPGSITNNGTVRYQRSASGDQTITDMDYYRLEISFSGNNKAWTLGANRVIADSLEINNSATLVLSAASSQTVTVNGTLRLTTGTLNNSNVNAVLTIADNVNISRATGTITNPPAFGSAVNVRYTSTTADVTTGPELPTATNILKILHIPSTMTVTLGSNVTVNDTLSLYEGVFDSDGATNDKVLTLASGATVRRVRGSMTAAPVFGSTVNVRYTSSSVNTITGPELPTVTTVLNDLQILTETMTVTLNSNVSVNGNLTLSNGTFDNNGDLDDKNLTLANDATIRRATGVLTAPPVFGTSVNLEYISTISDVTTGFEIPVPSSILNNLTLTTTKIATLGSDATVNGTLALTNSKIKTDIYALTANGNITGVNPTNFVDGKLLLPVSSTSIKKWETGNSLDYLSLTIDFAAVSGSDYVGVSVLDNTIDPPVGPLQPSDKVLKRYYKVNKGGGITSFSTNSVVLAYSEADVLEQGVGEDTLRVFYFNGIGWEILPIASRDNSANTITVTGVNVFGDFVISGTNMQSYITKNVSVATGWNLVSVPVIATDMSKSNLFSTAISPAYSFANGYVTADTLKNGKSYWIKFSSSQSVPVSGVKVTVKTIPVVVGWNMVGVFDSDVPVSQITSTPGGIVGSQFFGYSSGYSTATTLVGGKGYWVKATENGVLNVP